MPINTAVRTLLFTIDRWGLCFCPLAHRLQPRLCEMTRHVMWPHPGQHLWVFWESAVPDRWVWGDEQLMERLPKVMMLREAPFCFLILILDQHCLFQMHDNLFQKGQPLKTKLILWFTLFYCRVQMQLVGCSNISLKRKPSNLVHCVCQIGLHPACT